ncbi:MAG: putative ABC transport system permease protein [Limisphaerales bacterium]|jgi:putative ABC transport system permease protein
MLSIDFVRLVIIAIIIATPISIILARNWLSGFTYQIDMPVFPFIYAAVMAVLIALLTVSYQAYQAAISDPVKAIKYEQVINQSCVSLWSVAILLQKRSFTF